MISIDIYIWFLKMSLALLGRGTCPALQAVPGDDLDQQVQSFARWSGLTWVSSIFVLGILHFFPLRKSIGILKMIDDLRFRRVLDSWRYSCKLSCRKIPEHLGEWLQIYRTARGEYEVWQRPYVCADSDAFSKASKASLPPKAAFASIHSGGH